MTDQEKRESEINVHARAKIAFSDVLKVTAAGGFVALLSGIPVDPDGSKLLQLENKLAECSQVTYEYESTILEWEQWGEARIAALDKVQQLEARASRPSKTASGKQ